MSVYSSATPNKIIQQPTKTLTSKPPLVEPSSTSISQTPSPTEGLENPKSTLGDPTWTDDLSDPSSWYQDDDEYTTIDSNNGFLRLTSLQSIGWHGWSMHYHTLDDSYIEADIKINNCNGSDRYGLAFRSPDYIQGYFFGVTCDGKYMLNKYDGVKFHNIIASNQSDTIKSGSGQNNILGILTEGTNISLYINDILLTSINDSSYSQGTFGVFIAAFATPGFNIELDTIRYWLFN